MVTLEDFGIDITITDEALANLRKVVEHLNQLKDTISLLSENMEALVGLRDIKPTSGITAQRKGKVVTIVALEVDRAGDLRFALKGVGWTDWFGGVLD